MTVVITGVQRDMFIAYLKGHDVYEDANGDEKLFWDMLAEIFNVEIDPVSKFLTAKYSEEETK